MQRFWGSQILYSSLKTIFHIMKLYYAVLMILLLNSVFLDRVCPVMLAMAVKFLCALPLSALSQIYCNSQHSLTDWEQRKMFVLSFLISFLWGDHRELWWPLSPKTWNDLQIQKTPPSLLSTEMSHLALFEPFPQIMNCHV